jgi:hypothetical protein
MLWFSSATSREFGEAEISINFHLSAANFQMNLVVGSHAHFKLMKLIVNTWLSEHGTKIVWFTWA